MKPRSRLKQFLSTLSLRRATASLVTSFCDGLHFYPRSPCGERQGIYTTVKDAIAFLSTLSLRRATSCRWQYPSGGSISIHALLAESDNASQSASIEETIFLSTLSLRRATAWNRYTQRRDFISIHALLAESDFAVGR